jgi:hypothetical protein
MDQMREAISTAAKVFPSVHGAGEKAHNRETGGKTFALLLFLLLFRKSFSLSLARNSLGTSSVGSALFPSFLFFRIRKSARRFSSV